MAEWDGTNWVGALQQHQILILGTGNSTAGSGNSFYPIGNKILLKKYEITGRVEAAPANSATDYWTFSLSELTGGSPSPLSPAVSVNNQNISYTAFANLYVAASLNQIVDYSVAVNNTGNRRGFYPIWAKNGAAPNITAVSFSIQYRIIYE